MGVYCMKCIGYDCDFQKFLVSTIPQFQKEELVRKQEKVAKKQAQQTRSGKQRAGPANGRCRKANNTRMSSMDSASEDSEPDVSDTPDAADREMEGEEELPWVYRAKGTRSRPITIS